MADNKDQLEKTQALNELLLEMVKNQKENAKNTVKIFLVIIVCYTILLISILSAFLIYGHPNVESNSDTINAKENVVMYYDCNELEFVMPHCKEETLCQRNQELRKPRKRMKETARVEFLT